ncbi:MAG: hypothetical protein QXX35_02775 [Desulfurococcaceae archaeon]|uniref:Uncharacterized protein n=1 Tax=Staphylothermus marinus TaxID=2280 RepID=A0A7C4D780_STAMA
MEIERALAIKMNSLEDLVRLATSLSISQMTTYILKFLYNNKLYLGLLGVFRDYYKYYGIPIFYYTVLEGDEKEKAIDAKYIIVSTDKDVVEFSKTPKPGLSIPLITLAQKPLFIPDDI